MEKRGLIIGASSGIGKSIYQQLKKEYSNIPLIIIDKQEVSSLSKEDIFFKIDLEDFEAVRNTINSIEKMDIGIQFLINSAGYQENINILDISSIQWDRMHNVTVKSIFFIEQSISKIMINHNFENQSIVNITSIHTNIIRDIAHYSASKASLKMITKELAYTLSEYGIRVNSVEPGSIDTPLLRSDLITNEQLKESSNLIPLKRHGLPDEVANLVIYLISDKAKYITGTSIVIDGGLSLVI